LCSAPLRGHRAERRNYGAESSFRRDTKREAHSGKNSAAESRIFVGNVASRSGTPHFFRITKRNAAFFPHYEAERRIFSVLQSGKYFSLRIQWNNVKNYSIFQTFVSI